MRRMAGKQASGHGWIDQHDLESEVVLSLVVPVFNEEEMVHLFIEKVSNVLGAKSRFDWKLCLLTMAVPMPR